MYKGRPQGLVGADAAVSRVQLTWVEQRHSPGRLPALPLVTTWITPVEWGRLAGHGFTHVPKSMLFRQLGAILEDADPAEHKEFLASVPPPVRLLWAAFGGRRYARYTAQIRRGVDAALRT